MNHLEPDTKGIRREPVLLSLDQLLEPDRLAPDFRQRLQSVLTNHPELHITGVDRFQELDGLLSSISTCIMELSEYEIDEDGKAMLEQLDTTLDFSRRACRNWRRAITNSALETYDIFLRRQSEFFSSTVRSLPQRFEDLIALIDRSVERSNNLSPILSQVDVTLTKLLTEFHDLRSVYNNVKTLYLRHNQTNFPAHASNVNNLASTKSLAQWELIHQKI